MDVSGGRTPTPLTAPPPRSPRLHRPGTIEDAPPAGLRGVRRPSPRTVGLALVPFGSSLLLGQELLASCSIR